MMTSNLREHKSMVVESGARVRYGQGVRYTRSWHWYHSTAHSCCSSSFSSQPINGHQYDSLSIVTNPPMHIPVSSVLLVLFTLFIAVRLVPHEPFFWARPRARPIHYDVDGGCDYSDGEWVRDGAATVYEEDCPFLDPGFRCMRNGRNDSSFQHWRWQPRGSCHLPKFHATDMLERSRNGRIVFVGDSIGRNQWESMVCMLAAAVPGGMNGSRVYERSRKPISRHKGYLSMVFADYNLSVEYYRAPMLVMVDRLPPVSNGARRGAIRLDALPRHAVHWAGADVLVLNTGHWWNQHKTIKSYVIS